MFYFAVLTHNRSASLLALLESIFRQRFPPGDRFKIFVFDNASAPEHRRRFEQSAFYGDRRVVYTYSPENTYMRGKCHLEEAARAGWGGGEDCYLVHLDDDVRLTDSWLPNALDTLRAQRLDACGSVEDRRGVKVYSGQTALRMSDEVVDGRAVRVWDWLWEPVVSEARYSPVEFAGHRALMVRMEAADRVRHDPEMLIGGEDVDYSLALRRAGYSIGIAHDAQIIHRGMGEADAEGFRTFDKVLSSWRWFYRKWGFVRRDACEEAGLSGEEWLRLVCRPERHESPAPA